MQNDFHHYLTKIGEVGFVEKVVSSSLAYAQGLPGARPYEVVMFESGETGQVVSLDGAAVELMSFSKNPIKVGSRVVRINETLAVPVGGELLGAVVDPLGHLVDPTLHLSALKTTRAIDIGPPGIDARARITRPCVTGVSLVDLMLPLGKGQRELVIGDQKSGKSFFLMRALFAQIKEGAVGVYAVIGKSKITIRQVAEMLNRLGIMKKVVMVVSSADDPSGLVFLTPYTAMTIAEYFRDQGQDALVVLDDLSTHAKAYREIALLGRRFPGRNSYPGDIFYAHARLLERAGNFKVNGKECAITCLPVTEAVQGDITGYIQTNVMSMTDGHLFFDHRLFAEGRRPAIDPFLSVTRVGRQTQTPLGQEIGRSMLTFLRNASRMHQFASFGAELSEHIRFTLEKEARLLQFFDQTEFMMVYPPVQLFLFGAIWGDVLVDRPRQDLRVLMRTAIAQYESDQQFRSQVESITRDCSSLEALVIRIKESTLVGQLLQGASVPAGSG